MMPARDELLGSLTIDEKERDSLASGSSFLAALGYIMLGVLISGFVAWLFWPSVNGTLPTSGAASEGDNGRVVQNNVAQNDQAAVNSSESLTSGQGPVTPATTKDKSENATVLNASGYITARRVATVSAEITGLITEVLIEEGVEVEAGQVLALLDATIAQADYDLGRARIREAEAEILSVQANLKEAEREFSRSKSLFDDAFASEARLTQAQTNVDALRANLARAEASVEVARFEAERLKERLDDYTIRAPFAGVVTVKAAQPGEIVSPISAGGGFTRTGICTIVDMDSLEIEVDVNEAFIGRVSENQRVIANLDAYPDWNIDGRVIAIIPTANRDKATVRVRIALYAQDSRILPDMGVKVAFLNNGL